MEREDDTPSTRPVPASTRAAPPPSTRAAPPSTRAPQSTRPPPLSGHDTGPASARAEPRSTRATGPTSGPASSRTEELAQLYRKIADMQAELADAEARFDRAMRSSAGADEMVGQMLARVADVEAKLAAATKQATDAEARAGELATQLGKARATQAEIAERLRVAESRLRGDHQESDRFQAELEAARTEATMSIAAAEEAQDALIRERDTVTALRADLARAEAQLSREREERESLRARVREFAEVCDERDKALLREELLAADLEATKQELAEMQRKAASGEHRLGAEVERIADLEAALEQARARTASVEEQLAEALDEIDEIAKAKKDFERRYAEAEAGAVAARAEAAAVEARLAELSIERELHDGMSVQNAAEHEARLDALRKSHAAEVTELRGAVSAAEARAADLQGKLLGAVEDVRRLLGYLEQQEVDAARRRAAALAAARDRLDRAASAEPAPEEEEPFDGEATNPRSKEAPLAAAEPASAEPKGEEPPQASVVPASAERDTPVGGSGDDDETEIFFKALLNR